MRAIALSALACLALLPGCATQQGPGTDGCQLNPDPSSPGLVNSSSDHRSDSRFSTGVPVSASREPAGMARTDCACRVPAFLMFCASSQMTLAHRTWLSASRSLVATP